MIIFAPKDPGATEKFEIDFTDRLGADTIAGDATLTPDGVTLVSHSVTGATVDLELAGGTEGMVATVLCSIVTSGGETLAQLAVVPIGGEAVDLDTAKAAQRIEGSDENSLLAAFLRAAIGHVERRTSKNLTAKVETQTIDGFPRNARYAGGHRAPFAQGLVCGGADGAIRLYKGPVSQILQIAYDDENGVEQLLASFRLVEGAEARLLPAYGEFWPVTHRGPGTVRISYVAGYDPAELPPELAQAAVLLFGHFNANREAVNADTRAAAIELPLGVDMLTAPFCSPGIA